MEIVYVGEVVSNFGIVEVVEFVLEVYVDCEVYFVGG